MNKYRYFLHKIEHFLCNNNLNLGKNYLSGCNLQRYRTISVCAVNKSSIQENKLSEGYFLSLNNSKLENYLDKLCKDFASSQNQNKPENRDIFNIVSLWLERKKLYQDLKSLSEPELQNDKELAALANEEKVELLEHISELDKQIVALLVPLESSDLDPNCLVLEVTAGVGGQEAMLFASELLDMYQGYVDFKGWTQDKAELDLSELGGLRHGSISIKGPEAFIKLRHEGGVHRVQRVPKTEKSGRLHTSTVTVAVMPQPSDVAVVLHPKDLKVETKRSSGAGGQHVNTTDSCVRMTHIPSGLVVECQTERSQIQNREKALQRLRARLYQRQLEQQQSQRRDTRKQQVGLSLRSEKIRTYNYPQDRITDHRVGVTMHNLKGFIDGGEALEDLLQNLDNHDMELRFQAFITSIS